MWKRASLFKETCLSFVKHFILWMQMFFGFFFFCWSLAPHPLPLACQGDSRDWTHSKGSQQSPLLCWTFCELGSTAGSMHQKISNFSSLLWPVFHTDYGYQHFQHPHISMSIWYLLEHYICLQRFNWVETTKIGILCLSFPVESRFYCKRYIETNQHRQCYS